MAEQLDVYEALDRIGVELSKRDAFLAWQGDCWTLFEPMDYAGWDPSQDYESLEDAAFAILGIVVEVM